MTDTIRSVLAENYLTAFGMASLEMKDRLMGGNGDKLIPSGFEWAVFKRNVLDHLVPVSSSTNLSTRLRLYYLCGRTGYVTAPGELDSLLRSIQTILFGVVEIETTTDSREKAISEPRIEDVVKKLKEWSSVCANRVIKRLPKGILVSPNELKVSLECLEFVTECLKSVITGYSTHRACLVSVSVFCDDRWRENYNLGFCSYLRRLVQCIASARLNCVSFLSKVVARKINFGDNFDTELRICGECCVPVNVYYKPKLTKNHVSTDDILESVKYNCHHMCAFQHSLKTYEEEEEGGAPVYRVYKMSGLKTRIYTCPCQNEECLKLIKDTGFPDDERVITCQSKGKTTNERRKRKK